MANDRIFIICRHCKAGNLLAKYYPSNAGVWWPDRVKDFVDKHIQCSPEFGKVDLDGDRCFDLIAESDPRFVWEKYFAANERARDV
jgi:hypothetical protein